MKILKGARRGYSAKDLKRKVDEAYDKAAQLVADSPGNTYTTDCDHELLADDIRALKGKPQ